MRLGGICHYPNLYRMTMRTKENRLLQKHVMDHWWWSTTTARKFSNNIWPWELDARPLSDSVPSPWGWKCSKSNSNLSLSVPGCWVTRQIPTHEQALAEPTAHAAQAYHVHEDLPNVIANSSIGQYPCKPLNSCRPCPSSVDHWIYSCTIIASHLRYIVICKHPWV